MHPVPFTRLVAPTLATGFVAVNESTYEGGLAQSLHGHEHPYITYVFAGGFNERSGGRTRMVHADALIYHPHGEEHAVHFLAPVTHAFRVQPAPAMIEAQRHTGVNFETMLNDAPDVRAIVGRMRQCHIDGDLLAPLIIDGLACELLASCAATRSPRMATDHVGARRALERIEANAAHTPSLQELAQVADCHPVTLTRAFRRCFGCSIGTYVRRRRLEQAARLLQNTRLPIAEVALLTGFADQPHLTRALRRQIGLTPGTLRAFKTKAALGA